MKKIGFSLRTSILLIILCSILAGTAVIYFTGSGDENAGANVTSSVFALGVGIVIASLSAALSGILRAVIWRIRGYSGTPFVVLGLLVSSGGVKLSSDLSMMFETFFPCSLLDPLSKGEISEEEAGKKIIGVEKAVFGTSLLIPAVCILTGIAAHSGYAAAGGLAGLAMLIILGRTRSGDYHGSLIKCEFISEGFGIYYYLRALAAFSSDLGCLPQKLAETETETYEARVFDIIALTCWQAVFFAECLGEKIELDEISEAFLKQERMYGFNYRELNATRKRIDLNSIYCCYTIIAGSEEDREYLVDEYYDRLELGDSKAAAAVQKEIDWHRDLLTGDADSLDTYPLFRPIDFIRWFPGYAERYAKIKEKVAASM